MGLLVIKLTMESKSPVKESNEVHHPLQTEKEQTQKFFNKLKYFLTHNAGLQPQMIQLGRTGHAFALKTKNYQKQINQLIEQTFNLNLQHFLRQARRLGFTVRNKNSVRSIGESIILVHKQKIIEEKEVPNTVQTVSISAQSEEQEEQDDFPKEQEIQSIMRSKEEKGKVNVIKPEIIRNKVMSEGDSALPDWKKNEDASIQVKLEEQDYLTHLFSTHKKESSNQGNLQGAQNVSTLVDRSLTQKQNYERCSKMIDSTIIQFLQAHRSNKISQNKEHLMNNIAQIYDMLSNSIENIAGVAQLFGAREPTPKREQIVQSNLSSGFKSISES